MIPHMKRRLMSRFGKAKGYSLSILSFLKSCGYRSTGCTREPPTEGPNTLPTFHTSGIILNARGCNSFCGTNSATAVRMIPTFPFESPCKDRVTNAHTRFFEKPNNMLESIVQVNATRMMGFRPKRSEARPQAMPVKHWEKEKVADRQAGPFRDLVIWDVKRLNHFGLGRVSERKRYHRAQSKDARCMDRPKSRRPALRDDMLQGLAVAAWAAAAAASPLLS